MRLNTLLGSSLQIGDVPLRHGFSICLIHGKDAFLLRAVKTCEGLIDQLNLLLQAAALGIRLLPYAKTVEGPERLPDPGNGTVKLCMRYLHNYYREKITLEKLAVHVHLHPNYLCALFKEHTGETIFDYLTHLRVETAASILRQEDIPVSKLAEQTGFPSESFFIRSSGSIWVCPQRPTERPVKSWMKKRNPLKMNCIILTKQRLSFTIKLLNCLMAVIP